MPELAFEIESGQELGRFEPNQIEDWGKTYSVLTGYEGTGRCFWCGKEFDEKSKARHRHYCYGHMKEYYKHFEWLSARNWCCSRQDGLCANCDKRYGYSLEVHHIVPLNGGPRYFTAFNLPWNLIGFCHECHREVHAAMRPPKLHYKYNSPDSWEEAIKIGQSIMDFRFIESYEQRK